MTEEPQTPSAPQAAGTLMSATTSVFVATMKELGVPGGFAIGLLYVVYILAGQIGAYAKPLCDQVVKAHLEFVEKTAEINTASAEQHKRTADSLVLIPMTIKNEHAKTHAAIREATKLIEVVTRGQANEPEIKEHCRQIRASLD